MKAIETLTSRHAAQMPTYLKLSGHQIGFLLGFDVKLLREGLRRYVR